MILRASLTGTDLRVFCSIAPVTCFMSCGGVSYQFELVFIALRATGLYLLVSSKSPVAGLNFIVTT
jgi:hypothetical protein